jgi:hypothetical protein
MTRRLFCVIGEFLACRRSIHTFVKKAGSSSLVTGLGDLPEPRLSRASYFRQCVTLRRARWSLAGLEWAATEASEDS